MLVLPTAKAPVSMRNGTLQLKVALAISGGALSSWATRRFVLLMVIVCG